MNEKKLLESLAYIDDAYLLETEQGFKQKKRSGLGRRAAMLVAAVLVLTLTVSATYVATHWNETFLERFSPSEAVLVQTEAGIQNLSVMSQCDDVTLYLQQSLGDETTIYVMLDVTLPEKISAADFAKLDETTGEYIPTVMPEDLHIYYRPSSYADIRGMSMDEAVAFLGNNGTEHWGSIGVQTDSVDLETNTLSYLVEIGLDAEEMDAFRGDLTLMFAALTDFSNDEKVLDGPFLISWKAENHGKAYHYDIYDGNQCVGKTMLSGFSLQISLNHSDYQTCDALMDDVKIIYKDGTKKAPNGSCGGSISLPGGSVKLDWRFNEIQLLDKIKGIEITGYTCKEVSEKRN